MVVATGPPAAGAQTNGNACRMDANGLRSNTPVTVAGTATAPTPTDIDLSGVQLATTIPDTVYLELYSLGYYTVGFNPVGLTIQLTISATNTVEDQQTVAMTTSTTVQIADPDGVKQTGDESVLVSPPIAVALPSSAWTPTGGEIQFSQGVAQIVTSHFFGSATATYDCVPGSTPDRVALEPATPVPFAAITPPTPPQCSDGAVTAGPALSAAIDVVALCSDINGDIDTGSVIVVGPPAGGTASVGPTGVVTYLNVDESIGEDQFVVTIADATGLVSAPITITVAVQPLRVLQRDDAPVQLSTVILDGDAQVAGGALSSITITNLPASGLGFTVAAYATDLGSLEVTTTGIDLNGDGTPDLHTASCAVAGFVERLCIPARNMGWQPRASVLADGVVGGGATVQPGPSSTTSAADWLAQLRSADPGPGLSSPQVLCSSPPTVASGVFRCDADLYLGVPASAGAASYQGLIVITIL
jgi:hypothetical protein